MFCNFVQKVLAKNTNVEIGDNTFIESRVVFAEKLNQRAKDDIPNFNLPYCSENPSEFWRRWHISLSSWFGDYVYIPMVCSRKKSALTYKNILCTMLLGS